MQLTLSPWNMLLLSIPCLAYRLILYLGIGLDNSTRFAQEAVSLVIEVIPGVWTCRHLQTALTPAESVNHSCGERCWHTSGRKHGWEASLPGAFPPPHPALCCAWLQQQCYQKSGAVLHPVGSSDRVLLRVPSPGLMKWMDSSSQNHAYKLLSISEVWK